MTWNEYFRHCVALGELEHYYGYELPAVREQIDLEAKALLGLPFSDLDRLLGLLDEEDAETNFNFKRR